jgi:sulfofructosephosphate aldolase
MQLHDLARPSGRFAMVAIDQRESLRMILSERTGMPLAEVPDDALTDFKVAVARTLSPNASAILIDREYGLEPVRQARAVAPGCALIVAADRLDQEPGAAVVDTYLDEAVDPDAEARSGAAALKLLAIWREDGERERRLDMTHTFVERCHAAGLVALVEGVVRPATPEDDSWDRESEIVEAARQLGACGPDLYEGEVPYGGRAPADRIAAVAREVTAALPVPWVVLSQGVDLADLPAAVEAACAGGASGFLAGRAIWTDAIAELTDADGFADALEAVSVPRLRQLGKLVDAVSARR